ncbi:FecR domain-containing protein [Chloroflexota bacterium]
MNSRLSKALDECIVRMNRGESLEQCLANYSEIDNELRELLGLFTLISTNPKVVPSEAYRHNSKARVMARIRQEGSRQRAQASGMKSTKKSIWQSIMTPKRIMVPISISLVVLLIASFIVSGVFNLWSPSPVMAHPCTLSILSGSVEWKSEDSDEWTLGINGTVLNAGGYVGTDDLSHALLTFFDGSTIKLEPKSTVEIVEVDYDRQHNTRIEVRQLGGVIWNYIEAPLAGELLYRVYTPSAEVTALGTSFTVDVSESGSTKVVAIDGSVGVRAQGREIQLLPNQETSVDVGSVPVMPSMHAKEQDKLLITLDLPSVCSVKDPSGSSTGYLPSGVSFNQIKESQLELSDDGKQLISVSNPKRGEYLLTIRNTQYRSAQLNIRAVSQNNVIFEHNEVIEGIDGDKILHLSISEDNAKIVAAKIAKTEPVTGQGPEKVVVTDLSIERAMPVRAIIEASKEDKISSDDKKATSEPQDSTENKTPTVDDASEDTSRSDGNDEIRNVQEDIIDEETDDKDKISINTNEVLGDPTRDIQEGVVDENTKVDEDKISIDVKEDDNDITTRDTQEGTVGEKPGDEDEISVDTIEDDGGLSRDIQEGVVDEKNVDKDRISIDVKEDDNDITTSDTQEGVVPISPSLK